MIDPALNMETADETLDTPEESHESRADPESAPDPAAEEEPSDEAGEALNFSSSTVCTCAHVRLFVYF